MKTQPRETILKTNKKQRGNGKQWMLCHAVYEPASNICRSSIHLSLREDVGPGVKLQQPLSPRPLLFCLQIPSNNRDKNSLQSLTKILISQRFAKPCFKYKVLWLRLLLSSALTFGCSLPPCSDGEAEMFCYRTHPGPSKPFSSCAP